jgi:hypothetical protein
MNLRQIGFIPIKPNKIIKKRLTNIAKITKPDLINLIKHNQPHIAFPKVKARPQQRGREVLGQLVQFGLPVQTVLVDEANHVQFQDVEVVGDEGCVGKHDVQEVFLYVGEV